MYLSFSSERTATTCSVSTFRTVTGTCSPASLKTRVMPTFWVTRPQRMVCSSSLIPVRSGAELDFDVHAGGEVELHQRVHRLRRRIDDIEHALVRADFELLARLLVDVRRAIDRELLDARRQRDRPAHLRARPL